MIEVESKYRLDDAEALIRRLQDLGRPNASSVAQTDLYFAHPARDFAQTGEAVRIRDYGGMVTAITYKGPRQPGPAKTREELEVSFPVGEETRGRLVELFERLGFRRVAEVRKRRQTFYWNAGGRMVVVAVDEVEGLGTFAEVESLADSPEGVAAAQEAVLATARALDLGEAEPRTYLRMLLEAQAGAG